MTLGEQLKKLRNDRGLSQPELSELANIEQSYLSKLENDKSIPSNDIFRNVLKALNVSLIDFLSAFNLKQDRQHLIQIPDIEFWFEKEDHKSSKNKRRNLRYFCALIVIAVTIFYIGSSKQLFSETRFQYRSEGVVLTGEQKEIFRNWKNLIDRNQDNLTARVRAKELEINQRKDMIYFYAYEHKGRGFELNDKNGRRYYYLTGDVQSPRLINAWLQIFGVLFFTAGILFFALETRLSKGK